MLSREPVGRPLPYVPRRVEQPVAVGREAPDWRGALEPVEHDVLPRELALPRVGHRTALGLDLVAPRKDGTVEATPRCVLPIRFGCQVLVDPCGESGGIPVGDMDDGMAIPTVERRTRTLRVAPVGCG